MAALLNVYSAGEGAQVFYQSHKCPLHFYTATTKMIVMSKLEQKLLQHLEGVSQDSKPHCAAACDDLSGCTALAMTNAGNLRHLDADKEENKRGKKHPVQLL